MATTDAKPESRAMRLESWAATVCEYLQYRAGVDPHEINGAPLLLQIYRDLPKEESHGNHD